MYQCMKSQVNYDHNLTVDTHNTRQHVRNIKFHEFYHGIEYMVMKGFHIRI